MSIGVNISTRSFFDRTRVLKSIDRAQRRVLSRAGAFVRTRARSSIRRRKSISKPGRPPTNQTGVLKKSIRFGYEERTESVVIGPSDNFGKRGSEVPSLLEFGGTAVRDGERLTYKPRPFMGPALEKEAENFPDLWRNSVSP